MPVIRYDVFPALVTIAPADSDVEVRSHSPLPGTYQVNTARIIVTENRVLIAQDSVAGAQVVFSDEYVPDSFVKAPKKAEDSFLMTTSGKRLAFAKDESCGCGSRLRSWNPFSNSVMSIKNPTE